MAAPPQAIPTVITMAEERKVVDIALELYAIDSEVNAAFQEELQQASIFVKSFHCMYLLRDYEIAHPPTTQTLRLYLINPTAYTMKKNQTYFQSRVANLCRIIVPCETESVCCIFSKSIIHNPIDPYNNHTQDKVFLSSTIDLNFTSIATLLTTYQQKLRTQLCQPNAIVEAKLLGKL